MCAALYRLDISWKLFLLLSTTYARTLEKDNGCALLPEALKYTEPLQRPSNLATKSIWRIHSFAMAIIALAKTCQSARLLYYATAKRGLNVHCAT